MDIFFKEDMTHSFNIYWYLLIAWTNIPCFLLLLLLQRPTTQRFGILKPLTCTRFTLLRLASSEFAILGLRHRPEITEVLRRRLDRFSFLADGSFLMNKNTYNLLMGSNFFLPISHMSYFDTYFQIRVTSFFVELGL